MMNRINVNGRLVKDPTIRYTQSGVAVVNFYIAVNRMKTSQNEEPGADFFRCVAWRKVAENIANYAKKGYRIGIDGRLQSRSYEKNGQRQFVIEIVAEIIDFLWEGTTSRPSDGQVDPVDEIVPYDTYPNNFTDEDLPF